MNEPKNPYPEFIIDEVSGVRVHDPRYAIWGVCAEAYRSYYSKLAEGGREALIKEYCKHQACYDKDCEWKGKERCPSAQMTIDSLLPILGAMVKEQVEAEIKKRGLVKLAEDQSLPKARHELLGGGGGCYTRKEIIEAGFRRIEQPKEGEG